MGRVKDKVELFVAQRIVKKAIKILKSDQSSEKLVKYVNIAEKLSGDLYRKDIWDEARKTVSDPDNRWMRLIKRGVHDVDEHIIYKNVMNLIYYGSIRGPRTKHKLIEEHKCNIPNIILFDPTTACNMKCTGCWSAEYGNKWHLTYDEMADIVRQGEEMGCYIYFMTGGEPLVRKADIIKLAEEFNNSAFHIYTNGTLIDEDLCREVRRVGNITFAVSLEGFEDENDSRRGEGSYQHVIDSMNLMKKEKVGFACSICYTQANIETVTSDTFLNFLVDHGCFHVWYFHYMPIGVNAAPQLLPTPEQREAMIKRVRYLRSRNSDLEMMVADFQNDGQYVGGCIAGGRNYIHINAKGDIEPCVFIHYSNSNIKEESILEGMKKPLMMAYYEEQPFSDNHFKPCPMLENPDLLPRIVKESQAKSTDYVAEETPEELLAKTAPYAAGWSDAADELWEEFSVHPSGAPEKQENYKADQAAHQAEIKAEMEEKLSKQAF